MKLDRLIGILAILLQKDKVTAPELAERFEVSRRTILRDVEELCMAGIPVITTQGGDGGISIAEGFSLEKGLLNTEELQSVLTGLKGLGSVSDSDYIKELIKKLSPYEARVSDNIVIDLASHYKASLTQKINLLNSAITNHWLVAFDYYSPEGHRNRIVEPYRITYKWSSWYVLCFCTETSDFRLFKLNRLWNIKLMDKHFTSRAIPENKKTLDDVFTDEDSVTILLDSSAEYLLIEAYGPDSYEKQADGRLKATISYTNKDFIMSWILGFGDKAVILSPSEMLEAHKKIAENLLRRYEHDK